MSNTLYIIAHSKLAVSLKYDTTLQTLKISNGICELDIPRLGEIRLRKGTYKDVRDLLFNSVATHPGSNQDSILNHRIKINIDNFSVEYISVEPPPDWWNDFQTYNNKLNSLRVFW
jgi:hypothetical protein